MRLFLIQAYSTPKLLNKMFRNLKYSKQILNTCEYIKKTVVPII